MANEETDMPARFAYYTDNGQINLEIDSGSQIVHKQSRSKNLQKNELVLLAMPELADTKVTLTQGRVKPVHRQMSSIAGRT